MRKVALKYTLIKVRSKLSFECFRKRLTFTELMLTAILTSYVYLVDHGHIPPTYNSEEVVDLFNCVMANDSASNLKRFIEIFQKKEDGKPLPSTEHAHEEKGCDAKMDLLR